MNINLLSSILIFFSLLSIAKSQEANNKSTIEVVPKSGNTTNVKIEQIQYANTGEINVNKQFTQHLDPLQNNVIQQSQQRVQKQQLQKQENNMNSWVTQEINALPEIDRVATHQIFASVIRQELQFKWNPSETPQKNLRFVVQVFDYQRGNIVFPDNPEEQDCMEILVQEKGTDHFSNLGKVYLKKIFTINSLSDFHIIKVVNHYRKSMMVQISLESTRFIPQKALDDDQLKLPAQKIKVLLQELQQTETTRQKSFRTGWSLNQKQEHHQSQILILTGLQLSVIVGTAIVQMYCIKNLFDNRLIV